MGFDVVTVGNTLIDALLTLQDENKHISLNPQTKRLSIPSGEKFLIENCTFSIGGGASRVAIGLTRLGFKTAIFSETGSDPLSHMSRSILKTHGVNTDFLLTSDNQSSFAVGLNFKGERTLFINHIEYEHAFSFDTCDTTWIYLGSLGKKWKHVYKDVVDIVREKGVHLAFNPGGSQFEEGKDSFINVLEVTDVLFLNKQEAQTITNHPHEESITHLLKALHSLGPKTVVVTDGKNGAFCISQTGKMYHMDIYPCEIVEKTGAGDAFAAGFLGGILEGETIQDALVFGTINSASTIGKIGGESGLLTKEHLLEIIEKGDMPKVEEIT